jgi:hypothetical protein
MLEALHSESGEYEKVNVRVRIAKETVGKNRLTMMYLKVK